jgi:hypothetical protein
MNVLTPYYKEHNSFDYISAVLRINVPQKIILKLDSCNVNILPICGCGKFYHRRSSYYHDSLNYVIYIRRFGDEKWLSGEVIIPEWEENETPVSFYIKETEEETRKAEREKQEKDIKDAKQYPLNRLDEGNSNLGIFNLNALDYISVPVTKGIYEVFVRRVGLESNHMQIEIAIEK